MVMSGFLKRATKPKANVSITLNKDIVSLGEELTGTLHVISEEEFDAHEVRVEVTGVAPRAIADSYGASDKILWLIVERASGPLHLAPYYEREFPFSVKIPARPGYVRNGKPWLGGILMRALGATGLDWLSKSRQAPPSWLQERPEWRNKIEWTIRGVIVVEARRDATSTKVSFNVPLPPLTHEDKTYIQTKIKRQGFKRGIPLLFIGTIILLMIWRFYGLEDLAGIRPWPILLFLFLFGVFPFSVGLIEVVGTIFRLYKIGKVETGEEAIPSSSSRNRTNE